MKEKKGAAELSDGHVSRMAAYILARQLKIVIRHSNQVPIKVRVAVKPGWKERRGWRKRQETYDFLG